MMREKARGAHEQHDDQEAEQNDIPILGAHIKADQVIKYAVGVLNPRRRK
jgi:hypothetical protein